MSRFVLVVILGCGLFTADARASNRVRHTSHQIRDLWNKTEALQQALRKVLGDHLKVDEVDHLNHAMTIKFRRDKGSDGLLLFRFAAKDGMLTENMSESVKKELTTQPEAANTVREEAKHLYEYMRTNQFESLPIILPGAVHESK